MHLMTGLSVGGRGAGREGRQMWRRRAGSGPVILSLLAVAGLMAAALPPSPVFAQERTRYSYDALGRLVTSARCGTVNNARTQRYELDPAGNRVTFSGTLPGTPGGGFCNASSGTDFNSDGRDDILWRNSGGSVTNWISTAVGGFVSNDANAWVNVGLEWTICGTGDFNGDGRDDIVWMSTSRVLSTWSGTPSGGWVDNYNTAHYNVGAGWQIVGTGDFNGDGRSDILFRHTDGTLANWLGQTGALFTENPAGTYSVPLAWKVADTGDVNSDGRTDIVWSNDSGSVSVWAGNPDASFTDQPGYWGFADPEWKIASTGDFNSDGRADILWRHYLGHLSNWLSTSAGTWQDNYAIANVFVPLDWKIADVGDYNGDGRDDIAWRNDNGNFSDWLANANGSFSGNDPNAFAGVPTYWQIQGF